MVIVCFAECLMSKVYSFRLNEDNPREAQARRVIEAWVEEGYSLKHVLVDLLLKHKKDKSTTVNPDILIMQLQKFIDNANRTESSESHQAFLPHNFKTSVAKSSPKKAFVYGFLSTCKLIYNDFPYFVCTY